jgi:hypothetical protein
MVIVARPRSIMPAICTAGFLVLIPGASGFQLPSQEEPVREQTHDRPALKKSRARQILNCFKQFFMPTFWLNEHLLSAENGWRFMLFTVRDRLFSTRR